MLALGLSAHAPDASVVLVRDGRTLVGAREDLFTRQRSDPAFSRRAVRHCLRQAGVVAEELDAVVYFVKPLRRFERELAGLMRGFPSTARPFASSMFRWLGDELWIRNRIAGELGVPPEKVLFAEHQMAHAASAFLPSPFEEAAILTTGGDGEWATVALSRGAGASVEVLREIHHPDGLGCLQRAVARFLGLEPGQDEGRLMALAGWGAPRHLDALRQLVRTRADGAFEVDERVARDGQGGAALERLTELLGPPRAAYDPLRWQADDPRDADVACSLRELLAEIGLTLLGQLYELAPSRNLCLGGELARDPALNARFACEGPFERLHVDPAAGNGGAARGAALLAAPPLSGGDRPPELLQLGPEPGETESGGGDEDLVRGLVERLAAGRLVGWLHGPAELSARSTVARTLLADPRSADTAARIRVDVKQRDAFVPFGAVVPEEHAQESFEVPSGLRRALADGTVVVRAREGARARLAAVVHADGSVRLRTVARASEPVLHEVLVRFGREAGLPVLLSTTLRLHGEPMVRGEADGLRLFERSRLDTLVVGHTLHDHPRVPESPPAH